MNTSLETCREESLKVLHAFHLNCLILAWMGEPLGQRGKAVVFFLLIFRLDKKIAFLLLYVAKLLLGSLSEHVPFTKVVNTKFQVVTLTCSLLFLYYFTVLGGYLHKVMVQVQQTGL